MQNDILLNHSNMSTKIGKYDVLEILGRGGMGVVYKAYDPILDREVALKTMTAEGLKDPVMKERFYREARAAGRLRHPNIVTIYELGEENDIPYISMEFIPGSDVYSLIRMRTEVTFEQKIRILVQICRGLAYAHKAGIVHRDIKPSNIRLTAEDMHVKILDFGVARLVTSQTMTTNGMVLGTIHYMAPEQIRGAHVDRKTDIFAVGVIFYEMLTYRKPFEGDNTATVLYRVLHEPPLKMNPPVDEQFPTVRRILAKALDKDPARRYFSADEMADELEDFLRSYGGSSRVSTVEFERDPTPTTKELPNPLAKTPEEPKPAVAPLPPPPPPTPHKTDPRAVEMMRTAKRQMVEGHAISALGSLKQALEHDPDNPELNQLMQMVEQDIKRAEADELMKQAQQYMREGRHDIALKAFEKLLKLDPNNSKARMLLETVKNEMMVPRVDELLEKARKAYSEKKYQLARQCVDEIMQAQPDSREAQELNVVLKERITAEEFNEILRSAEDFIREQQFETANKALEKALKIFPQHPVALKRLETVQDHLRRQEIDKLILRGNKQLELGNFEAANHTFERILELDPKNSKAKMVITYIEDKMRGAEVNQLLNDGWRILMMDHNYDEVARIAEKILNVDPNNQEAKSLMINARKGKPRSG